jgi:PHD/YefM family antitoxin component YafN of YafNO toxin-antitoxin module
MRAIRIPEDFVPVDRFEKESIHWVEWIEASGRPVVVTRRGRAVAVLVGPDDYFGMSEGLGVLKSLAAEIQRGSPPMSVGGPKRTPKGQLGSRKKTPRRKQGAR